MNSGIRQAGIPPADVAAEGTIKAWLDALASGSCDASAFLRAMQGRFSADPDGTWEVLSQLDQYYRRGRIETEVFRKIKTALAELVLGLGPIPAAGESSAVRPAPPARDTPAAGEIPVARDIVAAARMEQTDAHPRREETQASEPVGEPKPGTVLRRRYRIEAVLGQGGMGTVFQVLDEYRLESPGTQRLAIKVLHAAVAKRAELLAELRREFQTLQLLSHPNIIRVFDFDRDGSLVFFTMELLTGATLGRILQARKLIPLERSQALAIIRDTGGALGFAHARGAVQGDLNLQNIFVTGSGELRVMSFGASHRVRQNSQAPDLEVTLPFSASNYASCEVLEGVRPDARDDVFSLACIAYLLLSGAHPFPKRTAVEARDAKLRIRRPADLSGRQWRALRSALKWERENRPADVRRWVAELELGAPQRLAPLNDLMEPPPAKESKSWLAAGIAAGVAVLLFAAYWVVNHRDMLPSVDSTAAIHATTRPGPSAGPASPAADKAGPPVSATPAASPPSTERARPPPAAASQPSAPIAPPASRETALAPPSATPRASPAAPAATGASSASAATTPAGASKVELAADTVDVPAGQASAQVTVHRKGSLRGTTSFTWWTESGTAKPGADFSAVVPQLAYVADGKSNLALSIPVSDAPHTQSKTFYVVIDQSEGGAAVGARTLTMVTLLPSD